MGSALAELADPRGPLRRLTQHLKELRPPFAGDDRPARALQRDAVVRHLEMLALPGLSRQSYFGDLRASVLFIGGAVWSQLALRMWSWPWKLLRGASPRIASAVTALAVSSIHPRPHAYICVGLGCRARARLGGLAGLAACG